MKVYQYLTVHILSTNISLSQFVFVKGQQAKIFPRKDLCIYAEAHLSTDLTFCDSHFYLSLLIPLTPATKHGSDVYLIAL
jgi:hypothetical protein